MKKTKGSLISLLAMVAAAGFVPMPVLMAADDEATVQSSSVEVDWETVNWKEGRYVERREHSQKHSKCLSPENSEIAWQWLQEAPQFQALPQVFKDLVEYGKDHYTVYEDVNAFSLDKPEYVLGTFFSTPKISIVSDPRFELEVFIWDLKFVKFVDEPIETPAVNPETKKYYVFPSNNTRRSLKGDDLAYVKAFTETVNRNIHYLGSTPVPRLDMKRVKQGEYIGRDFWSLSLVQPEAFCKSKDPQKIYYPRYHSIKPHDQLVAYFAKGDEETYRLQNVLGAPLYNPRAFAPEERRRNFMYNRQSTSEFLGVNVVSLCKAAQATDPERVLPFAYKRYFEAVLASCKLLTSGMESELSTQDKKSVRGRAVREVVTQATKYLEQIEEAAENCIAQSDEIYLNPPKTLLSAKVKGSAKSYAVPDKEHTQIDGVDWLEEDRTKGGLTPVEQDEFLNNIKKHPYWKKIPRDIRLAVEKNKARYDTGGGYRYIDSRRVNVFIEHWGPDDTIVAVPTMWQHIDIINAPVKTPPLNPKTGQPYVAVAASILAGLSTPDREYVEKLAFRLNENIHYLGNTPLPRISLARLKRGGYALSAILPLTVVDLAFITDKFFLEVNQTTIDDQIEKYDLKDKESVAFGLGKRLLLPLLDPRVAYPRGYTRVTMSRDGVYGTGSSDFAVATPIFLGWSYYLDNPEHIKNAYLRYLQESRRAVQFFMKKLQEEKARISNNDARGMAEKSLIEQAEKITHQMENVLVKELKSYQKTYKKPPRTLLDPTGKAYDAFIKKHGSNG